MIIEVTIEGNSTPVTDGDGGFPAVVGVWGGSAPVATGIAISALMEDEARLPFIEGGESSLNVGEIG